MPDFSKRRPMNSEVDPSVTAGATAGRKLSHRLFSSNKRKASRATEEPARKKQAAAVEEGPGISILEGITRGSIANMVLARLGKLNPNELIGPAPSKPPRVDQFHDEDDDAAEEEDKQNDAAELDTDQREDGDPKEDRKITGTEEAAKKPPSAPSVQKEKINLFDSVKPQPTSDHQPNQEKKGIYVVQSGPYKGSRGEWRSFRVIFTRPTTKLTRFRNSGTLHRIAAPEYFILQTDDGSVATVHQSQVAKTSSGLPSSHSYNRVKLTNADKKQFVEDVKFYLTYVALTAVDSSSFLFVCLRAMSNGALSFLSCSGGEGYIRREEVKTRGFEAANALKIAMSTLDPKRDVFRFRRTPKNPPKKKAVADTPRQPEKSP